MNFFVVCSFSWSKVPIFWSNFRLKYCSIFFVVFLSDWNQKCSTWEKEFSMYLFVKGFYALTFGLSNDDRDIFIWFEATFRSELSFSHRRSTAHTKAAGSPTSGTQECKISIDLLLESIRKNATKSRKIRGNSTEFFIAIKLWFLFQYLHSWIEYLIFCLDPIFH